MGLAAGLTQVLDNAIHAWQSTPLGGALLSLLAERQDKELAQCIRQADSERRELLRTLLRRGEARRQIHPIDDIELTIDALLGGAWLRFLISGRVPEGYAERPVAAFLERRRLPDGRRSFGGPISGPRVANNS